MPKPDNLSPLGMYGNRDIFGKRHDEGYTEVTFGGGDWVDDQRIVRIWAFYHPDGHISTFEHPKYLTSDGHTMRGDTFEASYNENEFNLHLRAFEIKIGQKRNLSEVLANWEQ